MNALAAQSSPSSLRPQFVARGCSCAAEVTRLQDRIEELEQLLGMKMPGVRMSKLSPTEWQLLGLLLKRPLVTREYAFNALYGGRVEADQPASNLISQNIVRLRRRLKDCGIAIQTQVFDGYYMLPEDKRRLRELIDGSNHA